MSDQTYRFSWTVEFENYGGPMPHDDEGFSDFLLDVVQEHAPAIGHLIYGDDDDPADLEPVGWYMDAGEFGDLGIGTLMHEAASGFDRLIEVLDDLPAAVKAERQRRGVTAAEVAQRVGYSRHDFSRFENGKTVPRLGVVIRLLQWLGPQGLREVASANGSSGGEA